jgi:hypothetical protein
MSNPALYQLLVGGLVSIANFGIHAVITGLIVVVTRHIAVRTDDLHVFVRVAALLMVTVIVLMIAHVAEISAWALLYAGMGVETDKASPFEFAFENYTALGYGDAVPNAGYRLIGPITALNGLLLVGWSVAIIFEVMKMAEVHIAYKKRSR